MGQVRVWPHRLLTLWVVHAVRTQADFCLRGADLVDRVSVHECGSPDLGDLGV